MNDLTLGPMSSHKPVSIEDSIVEISVAVRYENFPHGTTVMPPLAGVQQGVWSVKSVLCSEELKSL